MAWKIGEAKQRFSEVVRRAAREPQVIQNRSRVVAVVVSPEQAAQLRRPATMREALADLQRIARKTGYEFEATQRSTRLTGVDWIDDAPRRHKRRQ